MDTVHKPGTSHGTVTVGHAATAYLAIFDHPESSAVTASGMRLPKRRHCPRYEGKPAIDGPPSDGGSSFGVDLAGAAETALALHECPAAGHRLREPFLHQDVDGAPHRADGQAGLGGQIRDRRQLRGDPAAFDLLPQLSGELLIRVLRRSGSILTGLF